MKIFGKKPTITELLGWVSEAENAHRKWRGESWEDYEFRDNRMWDERSRKALIAKGINPLTINRIFPIVNLLTGHYDQNQQDIVAKGRTQIDGEISQVMSEALQFVMDKNGGYDLISRAFSDLVIPGIGFLAPGYNPDPRKERVFIDYVKWYSIWWDPYADPFFSPEKCKYVYRAEWKDLDSLKMKFPKKAQDIEDHVGELRSNPDMFTEIDDEGTRVEDNTRFMSSRYFVASDRRRVRPVEMWYPVPHMAWFAIMPDSTAILLDPEEDPEGAYQAIQNSEQAVQTVINKMHVTTFMGNLELQDSGTPYPHDRYPFVPFVGYLDRWNRPFGVPRMIKEQNMEVNKRRSMALSLVSNRRVIMEKNTSETPERTWEEANATDGLIVLNDGKSGTFQIQEMEPMADSQISLLHESEREIQEIIGANAEAMNHKTPAQSNIALENKQSRSMLMTSELLKHLKQGQRELGEQTTALIKGSWGGEKVLRVTDRVSGAEKWVEVNAPYYDASIGTINVKNNITDGEFDIVIVERPMTDTVREKNLELVFSAIQKSPPEAVAPLLSIAFELSDLPQKDRLLQQLRMVLGVEPIDPLLTTQEAEEKATAAQQNLEKERQIQSEFDQIMRELEVEEKRANIDKIKAEIGQGNQATINDTESTRADSISKGAAIAQNIETQRDTGRTVLQR